MTHKFQVGQTVLPAHPRGATPNTYVIVQVLPETSHERQYRIRALASATECVIAETQIKVMEAEPSPSWSAHSSKGVGHARRPSAEAE
ncbi:hypothetical protein IC232_27310 [Microvirga sp. BT688]|uniref:hypothetical protein n=1 Tax=Microvirga sp. TaxID=1873136 RepID=UPI001685AA39|nr:hypothetical protein [Microvirga sp.]MBD2750372.1 hypothetical protein [Microvirga sp.]